jgi:ferredoxin
MGAIGMRIVVDPIACDGRGLCMELLPEHITTDDWGFPLIADAELPGALTEHARRAVIACPTMALRLEPSTATR